MVLFTSIALRYAPLDIEAASAKQAERYSRSTRNRVILATGIMLDITLLAALIIVPFVCQPVADGCHDFAKFFTDHPEFGYPIVAIASPILIKLGLIISKKIYARYVALDRMFNAANVAANWDQINQTMKSRNEQGFLCFPGRRVTLFQYT